MGFNPILVEQRGEGEKKEFKKMRFPDTN